MNIEQFISKHSLSSVRLGARRPVVLVNGTDDNPRQIDYQFEFYTNSDRTLWVSMNRTRGMFRIVFHDLVQMYSDWIPVGANYDLEPLKGEQSPA